MTKELKIKSRLRFLRKTNKIPGQKKETISDKKKETKNSKILSKHTQANQNKKRSNSGSIKNLKTLFKRKSLPKKTALEFKLQTIPVEDVNSYDILSEYFIGPCTVHIGKDSHSNIRYIVSEPRMGETAKKIYSQMMNYLFVALAYETKENEKIDIDNFVREKILEISKEMGLFKLVSKIIDKLQYYIIRDSYGYGLIDVLMKDPNIEDIVQEDYDKPVGVAHRSFGEYGILDTNIKFHSFKSSNSFIQKLVQKTGKTMTAAVPYIDAMTKEGHRIAATFGSEVSLPGPNFTIRKFSEEPFSITKLLEIGTLTPLMAAYIWLLLEAKAFVLVIGSTSAGKTTTIGALSSLINPQMKITTIEDTTELKIGHQHWQRLITRKSSGILEGKYEVTMDELIRLALRSRPDYIIVGEVRGKEITSLIQAVSTGHGGLTSFHAFDARSAFVRMESPPMNVHVGGKMLISVILHQKKLVDASGNTSRRITEITEIIPKENNIALKEIFKFDASSGEFSPNDIKQIVEKSHKLKEVAVANGWGDQELTAQLVSRMGFLLREQNNNNTNFEETARKMAKFYYEPLERYNIILDTKSIVD